jgi:hypothetical protein
MWDKILVQNSGQNFDQPCIRNFCVLQRFTVFYKCKTENIYLPASLLRPQVLQWYGFTGTVKARF